MLTAGLEETAPRQRFAPLFLRHRAVSWDEGTADMLRRKLLVTQPLPFGGSVVSSEIEYDDEFRLQIHKHQMASGLAELLEEDLDLYFSERPDVSTFSDAENDFEDDLVAEY
jgi:hypothetical protein